MTKDKGDYAQLRFNWPCKRCGKPIKRPARTDKQYCSSVCRVAMWRKEHAS